MLKATRLVSLATSKRSFSTAKTAYPAFNGQTKLFINNKFVDAISGKTFETHNPATGEVITKVADGKILSDPYLN
jgi:hypothetical protein